ncbi:uncharacterized protein B0H18DRAFT_1048966 [Fomitopsis serialis]|uniref:uncharacterized protein n=1 Tax=Fomitopsis serialis TaxID=139415 RepID=UPI00200842A4|nr:uncharacterized protein B0H18DRAFT_1048966 [Neoantrodia serialis]KAH9913436.1 hypothetical protein B0H18DRAFT_1048966 [Neoantrodia serialis]
MEMPWSPFSHVRPQLSVNKLGAAIARKGAPSTASTLPRVRPSWHIPMENFTLGTR